MSNPNAKLHSLGTAEYSFNEADLIEAKASFDRAKLAFTRARSAFKNASIALERSSATLALVGSEGTKAMREQQAAAKVELVKELLVSDRAISVPIDLLKELERFLREKVALKYRHPKKTQQPSTCDFEILYAKFESMYGEDLT
ncbi:hypothetical protein [Vibrio sp. J383]|uniref:hypothetical protein n=1 Tax=Vibrio sp. J383 TaxID=2942997 RepID=UPI0020BE6A29|nr:hypothetical protein [Vibrio sp. J383]UQV23639.1 hypothetical protein M4S28_24285 [Vibrio sp. J383]UQV24813.1 hypothetical protein M4S28_26085 [Vibrio sp. J383]